MVNKNNLKMVALVVVAIFTAGSVMNFFRDNPVVRNAINGFK